MAYGAYRIARRQEQKQKTDFLIFVKGSAQYWEEDCKTLTVEIDVNLTNLSSMRDSIEAVELRLEFLASTGLIIPVRATVSGLTEDHKTQETFRPLSFEARESKNVAFATTLTSGQMPRKSTIQRHELVIRASNSEEFIYQFEPFHAQPIFKKQESAIQGTKRD